MAKKKATTATTTRRVKATKKDLADPKYRVEERVNNLVKKGVEPEKALETVTNVIETKELPDAKPDPNALPVPIAKGVKGPLGALVLGQKFFVEGVVGNFVLEKWELAPGVFDKDDNLKKVPVVRKIVGKEILKPTTMSAWFEETLVTVAEDFALLSVTSSGTIRSGQSDQGDNSMANKKSKKAAKKSGAGRAPAFGDDATVRLLKGPNDDQIKRHKTILQCLKDGGKSMTVKALGSAIAKASKTKQDAVKVFRMHVKALTDGGFISITPEKA